VPTASPTLTLTPVPTNQAAFDYGFDQFVLVEAGGFSFWHSDGLESEVEGTRARVGSGSYAVLIDGIFGSGESDPEFFVLDVADAVANNLDIEFELSELYEISIDGIAGSAVDYTGELSGSPLSGTIVAVIAPQDLLLVAAANDNEATRDDWEAGGKIVLFGILDTLDILTNTSDSAAEPTCLGSEDSTYGYQQDNPIRVGGDAFSGPARARAFLDNLLGPGGETIQYIRTGSINTDETILDAYELSYDGAEPLMIFIDQYSWEAPAAPSGLTCAGPFPLSAP
jgi:hypothetical protein